MHSLGDSGDDSNPWIPAAHIRNPHGSYCSGFTLPSSTCGHLENESVNGNSVFKKKNSNNKILVGILHKCVFRTVHTIAPYCVSVLCLRHTYTRRHKVPLDTHTKHAQTLVFTEPKVLSAGSRKQAKSKKMRT